MSTKTKKDATSEPVKVQLDRLQLQNTRLEAQLKVALDELNFAKQALKDIENDYSASIKSRLKLDIQSVLECSDTELFKLTDNKSIDELEGMLANFITAQRKDPKKLSTFKPIRAGAATVQETELTVGCLFGKSREEIRKMGGEF